jgi:ankyrin repeat protein
LNTQVLFNNYNKLHRLVDSFDKNSSADQKIENISKTENILKDFDSFKQIDFSNRTVKIREKTIQLLNTLEKKLESSTKDEKIESILKQISVISKVLSSSSKTIETKVIKPKIDLKFAFLCDIGCSDHNGAITQSLIQALQQQVPFITTRSLLQGKGLEDSVDCSSFSLTYGLKNFLAQNHSEWEIYQLVTPNNGKELCLFLPKSCFPNLQGTEKLKALDFNTDLLQKVNFLDLFKESAKPCEIGAAFELFSDHPEVNKLCYLTGHGNRYTVGALESNDYQQLLHYLSKQKCKGLMITACESGGESSLLSLAIPSDKSGECQPINFPILVNSIGDFPTAKSDAQLMDELSTLATFFESSKAPTLLEIKSLMKRFANNSNSETSYRKIYFPVTGGGSGSYNPICEGDQGFPLTFSSLTKAKLEASKAKIQEEIKIADKKFLYISPLINDVTLSFQSLDPILVSMVPGNAHHFLQSIQLSKDSVEEFIKKTINWHKSGDLRVCKGFFIKSLKDNNNNNIEEIVLRLSKDTYCCAYRVGNQYYLLDNNGIKPITAVQHALFFSKTIQDSRPSQMAIQTTSLNRESEENFYQIINSCEFWGAASRTPSQEFILNFDSFKEKNPPEKILEFIKNNFSKEETESFIFFLLEKGYTDLSAQIYKSEKINPNIKNFFNSSLFNICIDLDFPLYNDIMDQEGFALNEISLETSPLALAVSKNNKELIEKLLKQPGVEINKEDSQGCTPIFAVIDCKDLSIFKLLAEAGADLNHVNKEGDTLLTAAIKRGKWDLCYELLSKHKLNVNLGQPSPSALINQIKKQPNIVSCLLEAGAKVFEKDKGRLIPFVQALLKEAFETAQQFLENQANCDFNKEDKNGMDSMAAVIYSENIEILKVVNKMISENKIYFDWQDSSDILKNFLLDKLKQEDKKELVRELFKLDFWIFRWTAIKYPKLLAKWMESDTIDLKNPVGTGPSIFYHIAHAVINQDDYFNDLFKFCLKKKEINLNEKDWRGYTLLDHASINGQSKITKLLLEAGADSANTKLQSL